MERFDELVEVAVHSCSHVSLTFAHLRPGDIGEGLDFIVAHAAEFKEALLDLVTETLIAAGAADPTYLKEEG